MVIFTHATAKLRAALQAAEQELGAGPGQGLGVSLVIYEEALIGQKPQVSFANNNKDRMFARRGFTELLAKWEADAGPQPFWPLTVQAFHKWVTEGNFAFTMRGEDETLKAIEAYVKFANGAH